MSSSFNVLQVGIGSYKILEVSNLPLALNTMINLSETQTTFLGAVNYKSIGDEPKGIEAIKPINVVIGKNNSGKSMLLDVLEYLSDAERIKDIKPKNGEPPKFVVRNAISREAVDQIFDGGGQMVFKMKGYEKTIHDILSFAREQLVGQEINGSIGVKNNFACDFVSAASFQHEKREILDKLLGKLGRAIKNPLQSYSFHRILADRDLVREGREDSSESPIDVAPNGNGFTRTAAEICHAEDNDRDLIEVSLLAELNKIFYPDCEFNRVLVERGADDKWELFLEEHLKGRVRLSDMGSGVKTVLLVLMFLVVLPKHRGSDLAKMIFGFEELENNLHPAVQRRLFRYLREFAVENDTCIFLTTHSNVVVDMFSGDDQAQLLHVTHDGTSSSVRKVECWKTSCDVLDDLDIRASDVLQSNGVVWVEGPSDRIYFNQWMKLWTDGQLEEGIHYQCISYGGSIGAHLSMDAPETAGGLVSALRVNRNAILLIDRDKDSTSDDLKPGTKRLLDEVNGIGGLGWVTNGREVENYIPEEALKEYLPEMDTPGQFESVMALIHLQPKKTSIKKVAVALAVRDLLTKEMLEGHLDMKDRLNDAAKRIAEWNRIELKPAK